MKRLKRLRPRAVFAIAAASLACMCNGAQDEVKASSFGWNAADATACLQAAIDSGAKKVVIDRQEGDWIVEPIFLRVSGQEVVVADGVTVRAKKGSFKGSFKIYALQGTGKNTKLKKYTVNVNGVVVDGVGYGVATCKKPAASWAVTVIR